MAFRAVSLFRFHDRYEYPLLDAVLKSLCDLGAGMIENDIGPIEPLKVHLSAMRLVSPDAPTLGDDEILNMVRQLSKIHMHLKQA